MKHNLLTLITLLAFSLLFAGCGEQAQGMEAGAVAPQNTVAVAPQNTMAVTQPVSDTTSLAPDAVSSATTGAGAGQSASAQSGAQNLITEAKAKEIALTHAGVSASDATFVKAKLDYDDGVSEYEVEFYVASKEYDYDIDAITGAIRSFDSDIENHVPVGSSSASGADIGMDKARSIALAKVSGAGSGDIRIHQDNDDGRLVYEGEIRYGGMEYDFEIDAASGAITEWEEERSH